ncbi:MAG: MotA/TolQ/ExbB proton channel family protein [Verrucomicrobiota bacterium]
MKFTRKYFYLVAVSLIVASLPLSAQTFNSVETKASAKLETAIAELGALQTQIAAEKVPLAQKLNGLESEVSELQAELKRTQRLRDTRDLNLSALENEVKARRDEIDYAKNLLIEFITNQSASADASERQLYEDTLLSLLNDADATAETDEEAAAAIGALLEGVEVGIGRLDKLIGGYSFDGNAVLSNGSFEDGKFLLYGPFAYFSAADGSDAGLTQQGQSGEPTLISLNDSFGSIGGSILSGSGLIPVDPTQGKALAMETTKETLIEHIQKGGFWIYPILTIAFVSLIIAIVKYVELSGIKRLPKAKLVAVLAAIQEGDKEKALHETNALSGAAKDLLEAAIKNIGHSSELIEQSMEEVLMKLQPKLERLLSVIWITASTAPLLGLLGTVTGIITTFKLLTIFGSGDPKALGGGISEALITTEFGLIVAIPSLILHAFLQRKAKAIENEFEGDAMTLMNGILRAEKK